MSTTKIKTDFSRFSDEKLTAVAEHVLSCLTGNKNYAGLNPPMGNIQGFIDGFKALVANKSDNSRAETEAKNQARLALVNELKSIASWVQFNSNGDAAIMLSSGFDLQKEKTPVGPLPKPENLRAENVVGLSGSVKLRIAPVQKSKGYIWKYTEAPVTDASVWQTMPNTASSILLNLKSRTEYIFCVAAIGSDPTRTFSDQLTFFVL